MQLEHQGDNPYDAQYMAPKGQNQNDNQIEQNNN